MAEHLKSYQFQKGMEKIAGRKPGVRNRIAHKFLEDLQKQWLESGEACLKIMAVEQPSELAKLVGSLLPKQMEVDAPSLIVVATGVPLANDPGPYGTTISAAKFPDQLPSPVKEGDDVE
jgi:hypothetical protein